MLHLSASLFFIPFGNYFRFPLELFDDKSIFSLSIKSLKTRKRNCAPEGREERDK